MVKVPKEKVKTGSKDYRYLLPLLGLFTNGRIKDVIHLKDVKCS